MEKYPVRQSSLSAQVLELLKERIEQGFYPPNSQLPTEHQFAEEFKVSRTTIRSAFDRLEANGVIYRCHGIGTFVSKLSSILNPLNKFIPFLQIIKEQGFEPEYIPVSAKITRASKEVSSLLLIEPDSLVFEIQKVFTADGKPIIYCLNHIPNWVIQPYLNDEEALVPGIGEPIYEFFEDTCHQKLKYYVSSVRPDILKNCPLPNTYFPIDPYTPVLIIDEVGYNLEEKPIHHSVEYHPSNSMKFELIRVCDY